MDNEVMEDIRTAFIYCFLWREKNPQEVCKECPYGEKSHCRQLLYQDILNVFHCVEREIKKELKE